MASIMGGHYPGASITLGTALTFGYRIVRSIGKRCCQATALSGLAA